MYPYSCSLINNFISLAQNKPRDILHKNECNVPLSLDPYEMKVHAYCEKELEARS